MANGIANVTATLVLAPLWIASAVAIALATPTSGGKAAPIVTIPINIASKAAPMTMPFCKSPNIRPTTGPIIIGRFIIDAPRYLSSSCEI